MNATLITCSFRGDLDVCRLLCRSLDQFASAEFEHRLYVPERDMPLFADLASPRRLLLKQESLLPASFWKAPMPSPQWRKRLGLPRRNVYLTPHGPVRGWIAQQIMKIAASLDADTEIVAHLDSDASLVAPLRIADVFRGGLVRLYAGPVHERLPGHALWYAAAADLLGLAPGDYYQSDYIAPLVTWRRSVVEAMTARIEATTGRPWAKALGRTRHFSEYVLYGVLAEHGAGLSDAGLRRESGSRCLTRWVDAFGDPADIGRFLAQTDPDQLVCCLQSTLAIPIAMRARIFEEAARAVAQPTARAA